MDSCEVLPATGSGVGALVVIALAALGSGVMMWWLARHRHAAAAVVAVVVAVGVIAAAGTVRAGTAEDCPPPSGVSPTIATAPPTTTAAPTTTATPSTTVAPSTTTTSTPPATTSTTTTSTTTTSTTTTSTTATQPLRGPDAVDGDWAVGASSFAVSAFDNDDLGEPVATATLEDIFPIECSGYVNFDPVTGLITGQLPASLPVCSVEYELDNGYDSDQAIERLSVIP